MAAVMSLGISVQKTGSGYNLLITGTSKGDKISVSQNSKGVVISDGKATKTVSGKFNVISINGGNGADRIVVANSVKTSCAINGGNGDDTIVGGSATDAISGGNGNDSIYGSGGNDSLFGQNGNDSLYGNNGNDSLVGGAGDDVIVSVGGGQSDTLEGDGGFDSFWSDNSSAERVTDTLSSDERYNGAWHQIGGFIDFFDANGNATPIPTELNAQDLPDPTLDWDANGNYTADGFSDFGDLPLFNANGPTMDDIHQGRIGDCYFLSTLAAVAGTNPAWLRQSIVNFGDGTFGVRFMTENGGESFVRVDGDLPAMRTSSGGVTPAYDGLGIGGTIWAPILEKAWAYFRDPANCQHGVAYTTYHNIVGGWMREPMIAMGGVDTYNNDPYNLPFSDGYDLLSWVQNEIAAGRTVTMATNNSPSSVLVGMHAYTVVGVVQDSSGQWLLQVRNPWGSDGYNSRDGNNDGYVFLTASEAITSIAQFASATV
jgi:hypothetical protein